jgi:hypothetical protein
MFKLKPKLQWTRLDNAAKIFPSTSNVMDPKVFRCTCELYDAVNPAILQQALDETMEELPYFRSILKKGFFWYYLEQSALMPEVVPETKSPCSPLYSRDLHGLLLEVSYHQKRINLEVFHALTDGTGALQFLQRLLIAYICRKHPHTALEEIPPFGYAEYQMTQDGYSKYYSKGRLSREKNPPAYQLRGERFSQFRFGVLECILAADAVIRLAKEHGATVTELLSAYLIQSIHKGMAVTDEHRPVVLSIPVNLRNYFPSESLRNFFGVILVGHHFAHQGKTFDDILAHVKQQFAQQLSPEAINTRMSLLTTIEKKLVSKLTPLVLKSPGLRIGNTVFGRSFTAGLSNLGKVDMPKELAHHVRLFDVFSSTSKLNVCLCSYQDRMIISFTSSFSSVDIQMHFIQSLSQAGLDVTVDTNINEHFPG